MVRYPPAHTPPLLVTLVLLFLASGCGSRTQPVEGVVLMGGKPATLLEGYLVTFQAADEPLGASGLIQADGTFKVGTHEDGDGAVLGKHMVVVTPPVSDGDSPPIKSRIDAKYGSFQSSGLEVTIIRGKNQIQLNVEPAHP